jgi:uncharacterized lipoprotein YddW (UPF0748 family)
VTLPVRRRRFNLKMSPAGKILLTLSFTVNLTHFFQISASSVAILALGIFSFPSNGSGSPELRGTMDPGVKREFRALWVATVDNVDWPSKPNLPVSEQKAELIAIMDKAVKLNLNAIVFQVRPCCDAIYDSKIEPWSEYLTGQMGKAPSPYYDPLAFAIKEAHQRGLELHAWFNPYRARVRDAKSSVAREHVSVTHPGLVRTYGKYLWLDPTDPGTQDYSLKVIMDVVRRYDIDGVHFDDYFYPYPEKVSPSSSDEMEFPDGASWGHYLKQGGKMSRNDWRREQVNTFVRTVYREIKREKPWVKFGISPFGIWQPQHPQGITGFNANDKLFGDSRRWLAEGWVDYIAPQLYWPMAQKAQSFSALLNWWAAQNTDHRLLFVGMKVNGWKGVEDEARETTDEIATARRQGGASGEILWHSKSLMAGHAAVGDALRAVAYEEPALPPAYPWLGRTAPARPVLTAKETRREIKLSWKGTPSPVWQWVLRTKTDGHWTMQVFPGNQFKAAIPAKPGLLTTEVAEVMAFDRYGNLSEPAVFLPGHSNK